MRVARSVCLALGLALLAASALLGGPESPLGYLLPIAIAFAPLLAGRYPGERALARLAERMRTGRRRGAQRARPPVPPLAGVPIRGLLLSGFRGGRAPPAHAR
jgi:hypothetical protein